VGTKGHTYVLTDCSRPAANVLVTFLHDMFPPPYKKSSNHEDEGSSFLCNVGTATAGHNVTAARQRYSIAVCVCCNTHRYRTCYRFAVLNGGGIQRVVLRILPHCSDVGRVDVSEKHAVSVFRAEEIGSKLTSE